MPRVIFGSCTLLIWRNFGLTHLNWLQVFTASAYGTSILGILFVSLSAVFFMRKAAAANPMRLQLEGTAP